MPNYSSSIVIPSKRPGSALFFRRLAFELSLTFALLRVSKGIVRVKFNELQIIFGIMQSEILLHLPVQFMSSLTERFDYFPCEQMRFREIYHT